MKRIETVFMMNVSLYFTNKEIVLNFICVNKKCFLSISSLHVNLSFANEKSLVWFLEHFKVNTVDLNFLTTPETFLSEAKQIRNFMLKSRKAPKDILKIVEKFKIGTEVDRSFVELLCESIERLSSLYCKIEFIKIFIETFIEQNVDIAYFPKFIYISNVLDTADEDFVYLENISVKFGCKFIMCVDRQPPFPTCKHKNVYCFAETLILDKIGVFSPLRCDTTIIVNENTTNDKLDTIENLANEYLVTKLTMKTVDGSRKIVNKLPQLRTVEVLILDNLNVSVLNCNKFITLPFTSVTDLTLIEIKKFTLPLFDNLKKLTVKKCIANIFLIPEKCFGGIDVVYSKHNTFIFYNTTGKQIHLNGISQNVIQVVNKTQTLPSFVIKNCKKLNILCEKMWYLELDTNNGIISQCLTSIGEFVINNSNFVFYNKVEIENVMFTNNSKMLNSLFDIKKSLVFVDVDNFTFESDVISCNNIGMFNCKNIELKIKENTIKAVFVKCCENITIDNTLNTIENLYNVNNSNMKVPDCLLKLGDATQKENENFDLLKEPNEFYKIQFFDALMLKNEYNKIFDFSYGFIETLKLSNLKNCSFLSLKLCCVHLVIENCLMDKKFKIVSANTISIINSQNVQIGLYENVVDEVNCVNSAVSLRICFDELEYVKCLTEYVKVLKLTNSTCFCRNFQVGKVFLDLTNYKENDEKCFCYNTKKFQIENFHDKKIEINRNGDVDEIKFVSCDNCELNFKLISNISITTENCKNMKFYIPKFSKHEFKETPTNELVELEVPTFQKQKLCYNNEQYKEVDNFAFALSHTNQFNNFNKNPHLYEDLKTMFYMYLAQIFI
ncbi:hypothetical protein EIN_502900 [Entamoeba invadens IP1]|uniref:Uncharacterized protein n=1 Tax=Entamoeba invadens IP1 TaxID=370355 RepID=L7FME3_ENTIV|nr:hypothetical protein EIN_502900 [Entamoeba invadens IP1]ELP86208.1 hypothetical protein EIN_502900 [Entamoeba invadens IP1]|eukprot:XP_004185554.1 hypothetical protein EIN_502900 [Entamoeba invadens IP1]